MGAAHGEIGAADQVEVRGEALVLQHPARGGLGLVGRDRDGAAVGPQPGDEVRHPGVGDAERVSLGEVVVGVGQAQRLGPLGVQPQLGAEGVHQRRPDEGLQALRIGMLLAAGGEGVLEGGEDAGRRLDDGAVQVQQHDGHGGEITGGHCGHGPTISRRPVMGLDGPRRGHRADGEPRPGQHPRPGRHPRRRAPVGRVGIRPRPWPPMATECTAGLGPRRLGP